MRKTLTAVVAAAMVTSLGWTASAASAADEVTLREPDMTFAETKAAGHNIFLRDGIHVYTDNNGGDAKAAGYFPLVGTLGDVTNASLDWRNTPGFTAIPGQQIKFDADNIVGNGNDYNILVGEPAYGGNWWLTNGSSDTAKTADPSGANDGGNGSAYFGTLDEWAGVLPDSTLIAGGYSLGSGVLGDGIVREMTYGDTTYTFTNKAAPLPEARPVASATVEAPKPRVAKVGVTATQPEGTVPTPKGAYYKVLRTVPGAAGDDVIEPSEIMSKIADGRVREGGPDMVRATFEKTNKPVKVTVVSYGAILADKRIPLS